MAVIGCEGLKDKPDARVLVGGLGMGYTARSALDQLGPKGTVVVAEISPTLVEWNRGPLAEPADRPLAAGTVTLRAAWAFLLAQCLAGLAVLLLLPLPAQIVALGSIPLVAGYPFMKRLTWWPQAWLGLTFNWAAILMGIISLAPVCIYPFAKRFTWWPQIFLGLAFNWGALLAWVAHTGRLEWPAVVLYIGGICWTLFYDTIYAHQDAEDDALIGVKSTARLFGTESPKWLRRFLVLAVLLQMVAVIGAGVGVSPVALLVALLGTWAFGWHMHWQLSRFDLEDDARQLMLFRSNRDAGLLPLPFFAVALFV